MESLRESVKKWSDYADSLKAAAKNNPAPPSGSIQLPDDTTMPLIAAQRATAPIRVTPLPPSRPHTYAVKSGETLAGIARKQGISLTSLQAANPGLNPKKIHKGQTINLP